MVKVKVCGITNHEDYQAAVSLGSDYIGFIFYGKSPRYIPPLKAKKILADERAHPLLRVGRVGVFVNENPERVKDIYRELNLDVVQLHGDESPDYVNRLNLPLWKAVPVEDSKSLANLDKYNCEHFLLDTYRPGKYGGSGVAFDIKLAEQAWQTGKKIILAGGISRENIEAVFDLKGLPFAVDVNSSLESFAGKKCLEKMKIFFEIFNRLRG